MTIWDTNNTMSISSMGDRATGATLITWIVEAEEEEEEEACMVVHLPGLGRGTGDEDLHGPREGVTAPQWGWMTEGWGEGGLVVPSLGESERGLVRYCQAMAMMSVHSKRR